MTKCFLLTESTEEGTIVALIGYALIVYGNGVLIQFLSQNQPNVVLPDGC